MDLVISQKSDIPIYLQVYNQIASQVLKGKLLPDQPLPSIRTVAKAQNISVITVKSAYDTLEEKGFIYTKQGIGSFVSPHLPAELDDKKVFFAKEKLSKELDYFKKLDLSKEELIKLIEEMY